MNAYQAGLIILTLICVREKRAFDGTISIKDQNMIELQQIKSTGDVYSLNKLEINSRYNNHVLSIERESHAVL